MAEDFIEREIDIEASRERVWAVLTDARHVARWSGGSAEIDLRPGGEARFGWPGDGSYRAVVDRVVPPSTFAYRRAKGPGTAGEEGTGTLVEFSLTEVPAGTLVRVVETGFASLELTEPEQATAAEANVQRWASELAQLKEYAEGPAGAAAGQFAR